MADEANEGRAADAVTEAAGEAVGRSRSIRTSSRRSSSSPATTVYAAADLAGSMRLQYPTNIRMIKPPCTGKLEVIHLLKALEAGRTACTRRAAWKASATTSRGTSGRASAWSTRRSFSPRWAWARAIEMYNMSSAMGPRFAEVATEFTERIKRLGPNPVKLGKPAAAARKGPR